MGVCTTMRGPRFPLVFRNWKSKLRLYWAIRLLLVKCYDKKGLSHPTTGSPIRWLSLRWLTNKKIEWFLDQMFFSEFVKCWLQFSYVSNSHPTSKYNKPSLDLNLHQNNNIWVYENKAMHFFVVAFHWTSEQQNTVM